MTWLLVDVETSGLDPQRDHLIEVGASLFDPGLGAVIQVESRLVRTGSNGAASLNRIPAELLVRYGWLGDYVYSWFGQLASGCSHALAHNAAFDRQWLPDIAARWVCTCDEADWPRAEREGAGLTAIALAYDVGVVRAHRAIEDVLTLAAVLTRVHEIEGGLDAWLARATEARVTLCADVPKDDNDVAKEAGFRWDRDASEWRKAVRVSQLEAKRAAWPFPTADINEPLIELHALTHYDEREQTKAAGFRWDPARKVWWRKVRASRLEAVRAELGFRTREAV